MPVVTDPETAPPVYLLADLKAQLNLDHDLDDALLAHKITAAETYCQAFIGPYNGGSGTALFKQAVLMLAAYWYEQRESASDVTMRPVPFGVHDMLQPLRQWAV